ncbi:hypothetical protein G7048_17765 [Diaphorobacter sp. HDW4B]|uniref:hypothetical protein n=1 Tax=Diaphorobacter sp. HDW4B TaxID=2714925 RepID=UPI00140879BF|nr:hypothetical protein [Diaphorobacter sp. HDW4B]QIL72042.1 hypothetical protein G7048_17765 [Diaphorobacter sp. HDW4B]
MPNEGLDNAALNTSREQVVHVELLKQTVPVRLPADVTKAALSDRSPLSEADLSVAHTGVESKKILAESSHAPEGERIRPSDREYFEKGDLDESATPVGEWYVLAEHWPSDVARIELRVWISASGTLERWMVLSPQDNLKVEASLEYLGRTLLNPARRNGQPVASVMDVELLWAIE